MTTLTPAQQARKEQAFAACAVTLGHALAEVIETYKAAGGGRAGAMAVADAAWLPGGPSREEIAAQCERLIKPARASGAA